MKKHFCQGIGINDVDAINRCAALSNRYRKIKDLSRSGDLTLFIGGTGGFRPEGGECVSHNLSQFCCKRVPNRPWNCRADGEQNGAHNILGGHLVKYRDCPR